MYKKIYKFEEARQKIESAIDAIADPVRHTLSPKGSNVIFEDDKLAQHVTNDGATIAKNIALKDDLQNQIVSVVRSAALKTNNDAGDGTTTTTMFIQSLVKSGFRLIDQGWNRMQLKSELEKSCSSIVKRISEQKIDVKSNNDIYNIARISGNNDDEIAHNMVRVMEVAGNNGMIFLQPSLNGETEIVEDTGFNIESGIYSPELLEDGSFTKSQEDVYVLVTDKLIYYPEEAETIIRTALDNNYKKICIVAKSFKGKSLPLFVTNHQRGVIDIMLVAHPEVTDTDNTAVSDLAAYLGGKLVTEKAGSLVNNLSAADFTLARRVYSNPQKTVITSIDGKIKTKESRIKFIKDELKKEPDNEKLKKRLASLTNGTVTIKIGGTTPLEVNERIYRYEDAINATRAAMLNGYLVGGGIATLRAFNPKDHNEDLVPMIKKLCECSIRQIAENCGKYPDDMITRILNDKNKTFGYNAKLDTFEDLLKAGVIDPYKVTEGAIKNAFSVANVILTSQYFIVNDVEDLNKKKNDKQKDSN